MCAAPSESNPPLPDAELTYNERFREIASRFPDRVAFRLKTAEGYSQVRYREVRRQAEAVAAGLASLGLRPGERVAILSENRPEWVISYLGILLAGGVAVPLDPQISPSEWRRLLEDSEASHVFVSGLHLERLAGALRGSALTDRIVCLDPVSSLGDRRRTLEGFIEWAVSVRPEPSLPRIRMSDRVCIIYTSGTTGRPKGVMLTQQNVVCEIQSILRVIRVDETDVLLCLLPLQHVLASIINVLVPLYIGAQVTFVDTLKRSEILQALEEAGITILATVPQFFYLFHARIEEELKKKPRLVRSLFRAMLALNGFSIRAFRLNLGKLLFGKIHRSFGSKLRLFVSGGSFFDPRVARDFHNLGFTILQGYGLTETTGAATTTLEHDNVLGSVGKPLPGVEVRVADQDESGVGEVVIRGPIVMEGYYRSPEQTAEVVRDGWFHTGDLGYRDANGNLFITGRRKEVIVLASGKNIYPDELESHYQQCPYIQEIAVVGITASGSYQSAERLHGVVVPNFEYLKAKKIANAREILRDEIALWSNQLPKYKRLMSYQIQKDPLPRTTTRKVKRLELKKMIEGGNLKELALEGEARTESADDRELRETPLGREVLRTLHEEYGRGRATDLGVNLELDLGFDSMERVELLASLEQSLGLSLPDGFGAEIHTLRELIVRLGEQAAAPVEGGANRKQSWGQILSDESLQSEGEWHVRFSGPFVTAVKYTGLRILYVIFRSVCRMEVRGRKSLPARGPYLLCPNHLSYIDPFVVMSVLPYRTFRQIFFVGYSEYFQTWYMKLFGRLANIVPVDPDAHLLRAMKVGAYGLRQGRILCIFPEGGRSFDGTMQEFKKGAAILAREIGVPIVPVGLKGTFEMWPRDSMRIRPHKLELSFGSPLSPPGDQSSTYESFTLQLQEAVSGLLS